MTHTAKTNMTRYELISKAIKVTAKDLWCDFLTLAMAAFVIAVVVAFIWLTVEILHFLGEASVWYIVGLFVAAYYAIILHGNYEKYRNLYED